jgi:hypothetical protein
MTATFMGYQEYCEFKICNELSLTPETFSYEYAGFVYELLPVSE